MLYNVVLVSPVQRSESAMHACSVVTDSVTPWTVSCQAPLYLGFPRQEWVIISFSMFFFFFPFLFSNVDNVSSYKNRVLSQLCRGHDDLLLTLYLLTWTMYP